MLADGSLERVKRGLYLFPDRDPGEHLTTLAVCHQAPKGILCLLTALSIHDIGTQLPRQVWLAVDYKAHKPAFGKLPVRLVRFSGKTGTCGIQPLKLAGIPVRITSPARTVVDCFRYRHKIGLEVALEALRETIRSRKATVDEITQVAAQCRALKIITPYLAALSV